MRMTFKMWLQLVAARLYVDHWQECELCGNWDTYRVHAPLSTGEVVCWRCAERAGEFQVPPELDWRAQPQL